MTCPRIRPGEEAAYAALTAWIGDGSTIHPSLDTLNIIRSLGDCHALLHCADTLLGICVTLLWELDPTDRDRLERIQAYALDRQVRWENQAYALDRQVRWENLAP